MENNLENISEKYKVIERDSLGRLCQFSIGLVGSMCFSIAFGRKTLEIASKMYSYMQANPDFTFHKVFDFADKGDVHLLGVYGFLLTLSATYIYEALDSKYDIEKVEMKENGT